jgi:transglutaminase-like putative cysteine protease
MKTHLTAAVLVLALATGAAAEERWYVFSLGDVPVGYVSEEVEGARTRTVISARLTRLGKSFEMRFDTTEIEAVDGALQSLTYEALLSQQPLRVEARVEGDRIRIATPPHERWIERGPEAPLGPAAVERQTRERLHGEGDAIDFTHFSPELQKVVRVRRTVRAARERVACNGKTGARIEETIEGMPGAHTVWVDERGEMLADSTPGPFGLMTACLATREAALGAHGELPADLYERTVARSNVRFADPAAVDRLVLRLRHRGGGEPLPDFAADNQRLIAPGTVEIRRPRRARGDAVATAGELAPNALVQSDDAGVVAVAREVTASDSYEVAERLTRWVAEHMDLDGGIVMAPASELVRDRKATCVGYATLLAALARAKGIPSRVVMGYVYYGGIWGGHAWTELLLDGSWLPFDAAVYAPGVASAARLAVGRSDLADGGGALFPGLAALFGRVDVEVVEYEQAGQVRRVPADAVPYRVEGATYQNAGLGLRVRADGWTVERADSTWPSPLVVAFRRGDTTVELRQLPRYPERAAEPAAPGTETSVSAEGSTLWVWSAAGPDAAGALREILGKVER